MEEPFPSESLEEEIFPSPPPPLEEEGGPEAAIPPPPQVWGLGRGGYGGMPPREERRVLTSGLPCTSGLMGVRWEWRPGIGALTPDPLAQGEGEQY